MSRETSREARYPPAIRRALTKFSRPSQYVRTCACSVSKIRNTQAVCPLAGSCKGRNRESFYQQAPKEGAISIASAATVLTWQFVRHAPLHKRVCEIKVQYTHVNPFWRVAIDAVSEKMRQ